jgi:hypothetical protein
MMRQMGIETFHHKNNYFYFPDSQKEATVMSYLFYLMATIFHIDIISSVKFIHNHCYD